jgi:hypothetical protein
MDEITRAEFEKVHSRISDMKERVVTLEAQQPHINSALLRIEGAVTAISGKIGKGVLILGCAFLTPFAALLVKALLSGGLSRFV